MSNQACPCGSGRAFAECCEPALRGTQPAPTAEALMRSRYTAYVRGDVSYLLTSWHPRTRPVSLELADQPVWERLVITNTQAGAVGDKNGQVEFAAYYRSAETAGCLREISRFISEQGRWFYLDASQPDTAKTPGRNELCSCGSGKKFKRCCGG